MRTRLTSPFCTRRGRGVSLIEVLIGVAVATILTVQSLPALRHWMDARAVQDHAESLRSALRLARAQAMRRDAEVTVCALPMVVSPEQPACAQGSRDWSAGWVVFVDEGERGDLGPDDHVLLVHQGLPQQGRVLSTLDAMTYLRIGVSSSASARFTFLPPSAAAGDRSHSVQMLVCVNKPGRPRLVSGIAC